ncbi:amidohydrolase family protein [Roseomonas sp. BN140053]|uniref:amidohydrolase family protein n=1 Tax=Roseomonas sp. BN140053 TaxID=3391898 RepID=UPI0039EC23E0
MTHPDPILIDGALLPRDDGSAAPASVLVAEGRVAALAWEEQARRDLAARAAQRVAAEGCWLLPGLVDAHAHGYATLLRGTESALPLELWALFTTVHGRALDAGALQAAILLGAAERLRGGITATVDHTPYVALAETALAAHEASGLRVGYAAFLQDISDYDLLGVTLPPELEAIAGGPPPLDPAYAERFATIVQAARGGSGRVVPMLGPNAPQRCSPAAWALWRALRDRHGVPVHTHLLETRAQARIGNRWPGGTVAEMARQGLLAPGLSLAHGVWTGEAERELLARHGAVVVHNPASNMMLGSGVLPFAAYRRAGVTLALGTDSSNTAGRHDLFEAMRLALMLHRSPGSDPAEWPRGAEVLAMATRNGARVLGLERELGRVAPGQFADLVLLRRDAAGTTMAVESAEGLALHGGAETVEAVMVGGRWLLRDGVILAFDEAAALRAARDAREMLRERLRTGDEVVRRALPGIAAALATQGF